ncbi:MAG TPA: TlpA disulfide reductase family protein [Steroidobacteraceae bacterium]|nr:TlpA disulfide reductase family protein [Steroidobacteraceae bacterium]
MRSTWFSLLLLLCATSFAPAAQAGNVAAGTPAPDFVLAARDGGKVRLGDLKGDVVMINFWASWCGPCRQEMPLLSQLQARYEPLGFTLLGVNVESDSQAALAWLKATPVTFPILFDTANEVAGRFGVEGMPSTVFVDRAGNVRYVHRGYKPGDESKYADMIRSLVKE